MLSKFQQAKIEKILDATVTKLTEKLLGSVAEFKAWIAAKKAAATKLEECSAKDLRKSIVTSSGNRGDNR
jgi:uncharacterized protein YdaL